MEKQNTTFCRILYNQARLDTGCPPCFTIQLRPKHWGWYVEVVDSSFSMNQIQADNSWDAKYQCVMGWAEQQEGGKDIP